MSKGDENFAVEVRIPGSQKFTREQTEAIGDLLAAVDAGGFEAKLPRVITASATAGTLAIVTLTVVGARLADKVSDRISDKLMNIGIAWARKVFKKHPRQSDEPPRSTRIVIIYGPDQKPIKEIEVVEDGNGE